MFHHLANLKVQELVMTGINNQKVNVNQNRIRIRILLLKLKKIRLPFRIEHFVSLNYELLNLEK
jgi:hypothetical protein